MNYVFTLSQEGNSVPRCQLFTVTPLVSFSGYRGFEHHIEVPSLEIKYLADGVREVWLLTIGADPFFAKLGYAERARDDAPNVIRAMEEFAGLRPGDAILESKQIS